MSTITDQHPLADGRLDQVFKALDHPVRRQIIQALSEERPRDAVALTKEVADEDQLGQALTKLRHVHLPYLDDAAVLDWDRDANTLTTGVRYDTARQILQQMEAPKEVVL